MARVTVEDCIDKVENRFDLVLLAGHRARMISSGSQIAVERDNDKNPVVALREIADKMVSPEDSEGRARSFAAEIRRGRRAGARRCSAHWLARHRRRCRRYRGHNRPHERGRAAQGAGRPNAAGESARARSRYGRRGRISVVFNAIAFLGFRPGVRSKALRRDFDLGLRFLACSLPVRKWQAQPSRPGLRKRPGRYRAASYISATYSQLTRFSTKALR